VITVLVIIAIVQALAIGLCFFYVIKFTQRQSTGSSSTTFTSHLDNRTGLPNTAAISEVIEQKAKKLSPSNLLCVIVCEIDHLNLVRDAFSQTSGYQLIGAVSDRIRAQLHSEDILGLLSDDDLVIVTDHLPTAADLERLSVKITQVFEEPVSFGSRSQIVTCSLGLAFINSRKKNSEDLVSNARAAKNKAKSKRGSSVQFFDDSLRGEAFSYLEIERELEAAVSSRELEVHYQAVFDAVTEQPARYEALLRWFHPAKGLLRPNKFLDIAARSDLIVRLGDFVLDEVCHQAVAWSSETGQDIKVSVNIAEGQFLGDDLVRRLNNIIVRTDILPSQIELEFSEKLISEHLDFSRDLFQKLSDAGISLAIDNFGASNASIGILKKLPMVQTLKLDRQFVENVHISQIEHDLVKVITDIAKDLGLSVVAEGVETLENALALKELGVHYLQGFLYQRPQPADEALIKSAYLPTANSTLPT